MENHYSEDDYLMLSGIQHFVFCRRQWALIHIEQQWAENYRTADGAVFHANVHNPDNRESRGDLLITRAVPLRSPTLGLSGECDMLEYHRCEVDGIPLAGKDGLWKPFPVEYKRGSPHTDNADEQQLCAQAMCLEEMLCCSISEGALYYGETHHRIKIVFTEELRSQTIGTITEMHDIYKRGYTPKVKPKKECRSCSLKDLCLPQLVKKQKVSEYLSERMADE